VERRDPEIVSPSSVTDARYRKSERLLRRPDFVRVQTSTRGQGTRFLRVLAVVSPAQRRRFGVTVSRKVGNAVVRNLVKRRLREIFRQNKDRFPEAMDIVVIARPSARGASYAGLSEDLLRWAAEARRRARAGSEAKTR